MVIPRVNTLTNIAIYSEDPDKKEVAIELSHKLHLPITQDPNQYQFILAVTTQHLELRLPQANLQPLTIDFFKPAAQQRLQKSTHRNELIARAVGLKAHYYPHVVDATAGFGNDASILASLGCTVDMIERSPIMAALLQDGLERAPDLLKNLRLHCEDAKDFLRRQTIPIDVVYLDPMFPIRTKSALVKKEMRILKELVGQDEDAAELFALALQTATKRVVVKRPSHAPTLTAKIPDITYESRALRFDVYLKGLKDLKS
jgi:16S rRNA (guanine1516-N2)-methyltransferase